MTLGAILAKEQIKNCMIMYREFINMDGEQLDALLGFCAYSNGELTPADDDIYSLGDSVTKYEVDCSNNSCWLIAYV